MTFGVSLETHVVAPIYGVSPLTVGVSHGTHVVVTIYGIWSSARNIHSKKYLLFALRHFLFVFRPTHT